MTIEKQTSELLGIPQTSDRRVLLGIAKGRRDRIAIQNALRRRLAQIQVHPEGYTKLGIESKTFLESIAADLLKHAPNQPIQSNNDPELTPLDQSIIAALISEGGWNKNSRSRLVGVAASYSITVGGLIRILEAFAEAARSGTGPLSLKQRSTHTIDRSWTSLPSKSSPMSAVDSFITDAAKKFTPELSTPSPIMTIKLAILFGLLTIVAFILALQVLLNDTTTNVSQESTIKSSFPSQEPNVTIKQHIAIFDDYPTFHIDGTEESILHYADLAPTAPDELATIATSIQASLTAGKEPDRRLLLQWNDSIDAIAYGWPYVNSRILQSTQTQLIQVFLHAEMYPQFANELLQSFQIPDVSIGKPNQIQRIVWNVNTLANLSFDQRLNANTRNIAKKLQLPSILTSDEKVATNLALHQIADELLKKTEFDNRSLEMWESWFIAAKELQNANRDKVSIQYLYLIQSILDSKVDLLRESNTRKVLGKTIQVTEWSDSTTLRDKIIALLKDASSTNTDLSVLTTLFNASTNTTWFTDQYLITESSTNVERETIANQLVHDWPIDTSELVAVSNLIIPVGLDIELVESWQKKYQNIIRLDEDSLLRFAFLRSLNEAAVSIWRGRPDLARNSLLTADRIEVNADSLFKQSIVNSEGTFSSIFKAAGNDQYDQVDAIEILLNDSLTDLGKSDADLLASLALTNRRSKVRSAATNVIIEQFKHGSNVATAIVQHFSRARSNEEISSLVANLTNSILPSPDHPKWQLEARKALLQHALTAGDKMLFELDEISNIISTSLVSEYLLLNPSALPLSGEVLPLEALDMVVASWRRVLPPSFVQQTTLDFSPSGVLQQYLLKQIEYFALLKSEESRWRSQKQVGNPVSIVLAKLQSKNSIIEQLNTVELEIANHWNRLLSEVVTENERRYQE